MTVKSERMDEAAGRPRVVPPVPWRMEDLGIPEGLLTDLMLRRALIDGNCSLSAMSRTLKLSHGILEPEFRRLRQQQLLDVRGMVGEDYSFGLTQAGNRAANNRRKQCHYAGPAPVSLKDYERMVKAQSGRVKLDLARLREVFQDLVISDERLAQVGPAVVSQRSLFLYGPTGNGKTSIAERLQAIYRDVVFLPYAVEVDGQVISVYDPVVHQRVEFEAEHYDERWVPCKRPFLVVGGEMTGSMLDLRLDLVSQIYAAPLQMKANNGILVIDDFGRQTMSPRKLLNRWIVPLDRRVDYLSLSYGVKFRIPFELMVVFATNLHPHKLADEAFLRRIQNKVYIGPVGPETFDEIYRRVTLKNGWPYTPEAAALARELCWKAGCTVLRACYPGDISGIAASIASFEERPVTLERSDLERAVEMYFTRTEAALMEDEAGRLPEE